MGGEWGEDGEERRKLEHAKATRIKTDKIRPINNVVILTACRPKLLLGFYDPHRRQLS